MNKTHYLSYLLRLWMVKAADGNQWRALLESPLTGERIGFPNMEALFTYLESIALEATNGDIADENKCNEMQYSSSSNLTKGE